MKRILLLVTIFALMVTGCSTSSTSEATIRFAYLPIVDSLPLFVAQKEGLFEKNNVKVELIPVTSAPERDQLLQAGQVDGVINEILNVMQFNKDGVKIQVVRHALMADKNTAHFFVLTSKDSGITDVAGLKGVEIGISQGTIIEYVTTRLLQSEGLTKDDIKYIAIPKLPDRLALLMSGEAKAVVLPDPLASMAISKGAVDVIDDRIDPAAGASVISLSKSLLDSDPNSAKAFLNAINEASMLINNDPAKYKALLAENKVVPADLIDSFQFPAFPQNSIPSESEWMDVSEWATTSGILPTHLSYTESVSDKFIK